MFHSPPSKFTAFKDLINQLPVLDESTSLEYEMLAVHVSEVKLDMIFLQAVPPKNT